MKGPLRVIHRRIPQKGRCAAFTLVELLVVIAVIAILAALLLPALSRAKAAALSAACKSNLHQIGVGLRLYADEARRYPSWGDGPFTNANHWDALILPCTGGSLAVFLCPARKPSSQWTNLLDFNPTYGYNADGTWTPLIQGSVNYGLGGDGAAGQIIPLSESRIAVPSDMIAIADYPELTRQDGDIAGALDEPDDYVADRHNKGANIAFCDTHVEFGKQTNWMKADQAVRKRWNNDNRPHPETWH